MAGLILFNNVVRDATVVSEDTLTDHGIANALDGRIVTQAGFNFGADRDVIFDLTTATSVDTIALARHNFNDLTSVDFSLWGSSDDISYTNVSGVLNVTSSNVYVKTFSSASYRYWRLRVNCTGGFAYVSDIFIGTKLDLERSQKFGFTPPQFANQDRIIENVTRGQNLAGITVTQHLRNVQFDLFYYTESFFDTNWLTLVTAMRQYPVYILWYDNEVPFYCWPRKQIPEPKYSANATGYYTVRLDMNGISF